MHVPVWHGVPDVQHGPPEMPHSAHVLVVSPATVVHTVSVSVQTLPGQHGSSMVPHDPQKPSEAHTCSSPPSIVHDPPVATHVAVAVES